MRLFGGGDELLTAKMLPDSNFNLWDGTSDFSGSSWVVPLTLLGGWHDKINNFVVQTEGADKAVSQKVQCYEGEVYTLSAYVLASNLSETNICFFGDVKAENTNAIKDADNYVSIPAGSSPWKRISYSFVIAKDGFMEPRFENTKSGFVQWGSFMLNRGPIAMPWNISFNDLKAKFQNQ